MILEDVKLSHARRSEAKSPYFFRCRISKISTDNGFIQTPVRATTRTELIARSNVPIFKSIPIQIAIDFRQLDDLQVSEIMNNGKPAYDLLKLTKQFNDITKKAKLRFSVFQPSNSRLSNMSSEEKMKFADFQAEFYQRKLGTRLVTYPFLDLPISEYKSFIDERYDNQNEISVIHTLDMRKERRYLQEILDHLISKGYPLIVNLIYKNWQRTIPQHDLINSYFDNEKVAFFASQVEREEPESHSSNIHSVAFGGGFDLVSLLQVRGHSDKTQDLSLNKIRFFDPDSLGIDDIETILHSQNRDILKELRISETDLDFKYIRNMLSGFRGALIHPIKHRILYFLARCHEAVLSPIIFDLKRSMIENGEIAEHIVETKLRNAPMIQRRH
jgi:hypothetical protein